MKARGKIMTVVCISVVGVLSWVGPGWSGSTTPDLPLVGKSNAGEYVVVDDFDSYEDMSELYDVWNDYWVNGTASEIFLETDPTFTRDGNSVQFLYHNSFKKGGKYTGSVIDAAIADLGIKTDWTSYKSIALWFYGRAGNSATENDVMWVQLDDANNNTGVVIYDGDASDLTEEWWHEWDINLSLFEASGVILDNVDKVHIGFGGYEQTGQTEDGGTGTVYFDDIRLCGGVGRKAYDPSPDDGATGVDPYVTLTWSWGKDASSHNVYFGTDFDDVNTADTSDVTGIYKGLHDPNSYTPAEIPLDHGKTYYWRIDEVNGPSTVKGDIWVFTTRGGGVIPGLIAHWKFDEGTGGTAYDSVGNNDGIIHGAMWTSGQIGGALDFDGAGDYVDLSSTVQFDDEDFTITGWFRTASNTSGTYEQIWMSGYQGGGEDLEVVMKNNELYFYAREASFAYLGQSAGIANDGIWHHFAALRNGNNFLLYFDGVLASSASKALGDLDEPGVVPRIGNGLYIVVNRFFDGSIDDVRIYDRALSAWEIQYLYGGGLENTAPIACIVGGDRVVEAGGDCQARITLDGSCSSDEDSTAGTNDDINDFDWYEVIDACEPNSDIYLGSGEVIECNLGLGEHLIILEVTDKAGAFDSNEVVITVEDVTPPEFSLVVEPNMITVMRRLRFH
jgi:hypothetical protein